MAQGPLVLAMHAILDGIEDVIGNLPRREARHGTICKDTGLYEDGEPGIPVAPGGVVVLVGAADIGLGGVADEVDRFGGRVDAVRLLPPLLKQSRGELEGAELRLAEGDGVQLFTRDGLVEGLCGGAEGAHPDPRVLVGS